MSCMFTIFSLQVLNKSDLEVLEFLMFSELSILEWHLTLNIKHARTPVLRNFQWNLYCHTVQSRFRSKVIGFEILLTPLPSTAPTCFPAGGCQEGWRWRRQQRWQHRDGGGGLGVWWWLRRRLSTNMVGIYGPIIGLWLTSFYIGGRGVIWVLCNITR